MRKICVFRKKLSQSTCQSFMTHFWVVTHSLGNADIQHLSNPKMVCFVTVIAISYSIVVDIIVIHVIAVLLTSTIHVITSFTVITVIDITVVIDIVVRDAIVYSVIALLALEVRIPTQCVR